MLRERTIRRNKIQLSALHIHDLKGGENICDNCATFACTRLRDTNLQCIKKAHIDNSTCTSAQRD